MKPEPFGKWSRHRLRFSRLPAITSPEGQLSMLRTPEARDLALAVDGVAARVRIVPQ